MTDRAEVLNSVFDQFSSWLKSRPDLTADRASARREFFAMGGDPADGDLDDLAAELAERRFYEWYALERFSPVLDELPITFLGKSADADDADDEESQELLEWYGVFLNSHASVFEVSEARPGEGYWLRDLCGRGQYPIEDPGASGALLQGDLLVGRLFTLENGVHELSSATACFRNPQLAQALERDIASARQARRGPLRIEQRELEGMFFQVAVPEAKPEDRRVRLQDLEQRTRAALDAGDVDAEAIDALLERLRCEPYSPSLWAHGGGDTMGELLDVLAFETSVDLEEVRRLLLELWPLYALQTADALEQVAAKKSAQGGPDSTAAAKQALDRQAKAAALDAFNEARAEGVDLDEAIRELSVSLGLDPEDINDLSEAGDSKEAIWPAPGTPESMEFASNLSAASAAAGGSQADAATDDDANWTVVGAMVEEFLWERSTDGHEVPPIWKRLRDLTEALPALETFEDLKPTDLLRYATFWLPESSAPPSPDDVAELMAALAAFVEWSVASQCHEPLAELREDLEALREELPRVMRANQILRTGGAADVAGSAEKARAASSRADVPEAGGVVGSAGWSSEGEPGELFEVVHEAQQASASDASVGLLRVRDLSGRERSVALEPLRVAEALLSGDRLRAQVRSEQADSQAGDAESAADSASGRQALRVHCIYPAQIAALEADFL